VRGRHRLHDARQCLLHNLQSRGLPTVQRVPEGLRDELGLCDHPRRSVLHVGQEPRQLGDCGGPLSQSGLRAVPQGVRDVERLRCDRRAVLQRHLSEHLPAGVRDGQRLLGAAANLLRDHARGGGAATARVQQRPDVQRDAYLQHVRRVQHERGLRRMRGVRDTGNVRRDHQQPGLPELRCDVWVWRLRRLYGRGRGDGLLHGIAGLHVVRELPGLVHVLSGVFLLRCSVHGIAVLRRLLDVPHVAVWHLGVPGMRNHGRHGDLLGFTGPLRRLDERDDRLQEPVRGRGVYLDGERCQPGWHVHGDACVVQHLRVPGDVHQRLHLANRNDGLHGDHDALQPAHRIDVLEPGLHL
jgi:hypothetical protein